MNPQRQPQAAMMAEMPTAPSAGPAAAPAPKMALASARSVAGNHSRMMRLEAGQEVESHIPMTIRLAMTNKCEGARPVHTVASDQRPMPQALTILPQKRSTRSPTGMRQKT